MEGTSAQTAMGPSCSLFVSGWPREQCSRIQPNSASIYLSDMRRKIMPSLVARNGAG